MIQSQIGINNIPFCYKGTDEADVTVTFPSVSENKWTDLLTNGSFYIASASASSSTIISQTFSAPYIFCNGIFVKKGETISTLVYASGFILPLGDYPTEYKISYTTNGNVELTTVANYCVKSTTSISSSQIKLTANSKELVIKPCQSPINEINFSGNSVNMLKYGDNIVWLKKIEPVITRK